MSDTTTTDDFEAAKKVFEQLKSLPKERQERVLRWVSETLGVAGPAHNNPSTGAQLSQHSTLTGLGTVAAASGSRDIRTFVAEKAPSSDNQFAAVVAYYYRFEAPLAQQRKNISGADLQEAARLAGRKRLANPRQTLKNAKALGYLDNPARGEFAINTVGENLVAMTLPGGVDAAAKRGSKRGRGRPTRKSGKRK